MIRINLLGQIRPKASRRQTMAVDTGGAMPVAFIGVGVLVGVLVTLAIAELLQHGADPSIRNTFGETPFGNY